MRLDKTAGGKATTATTTGATVPTGAIGAELGQISVMRVWAGVDSGSSLVGVADSSLPSQVDGIGIRADLRTIIGIIVGMLDG